MNTAMHDFGHCAGPSTYYRRKAIPKTRLDQVSVDPQLYNDHVVLSMICR